MPEDDQADLYYKLPGLFRSWDVAQVLAPANSYRIEDGGSTTDGAPLFAIYCAIQSDAEGSAW